MTAHYPDELPALPPRSRGVIALMEENCTVCMLCARECPAWCIYIDSHKETVPPATEGGRERSRNMLDRFAIDFSLCMYCSICIEACPFDALALVAGVRVRRVRHPRPDPREGTARGLDVDGAPPPALDPASPAPKEIATAEKAAERATRKEADG